MSLVSTGVIIQHTTCTKSTLNLVPITNGQLIYVSDNNEIYYDTEGARKPIVDIMILNTQYEFDNLLAPLIKFYFIVETNKFYYYTGTDWILLNSSDNDVYSINKLDWILFGSNYDYVSQKTNTNPVTWVEQAKNDNIVYATKTSVRTNDTTWTIRYECPSKNIDETFTIINNNGVWTEHKVTT